MSTKTRNTIPHFADVPLQSETSGNPSASNPPTQTNWLDAIGGDAERLAWKTNEQIPISGLYTSADLKDVDHLETMPGLAPFLRGPYPTMYVMRPWTVRQYAGFSTAKESNAFYRRNLSAG